MIDKKTRLLLEKQQYRIVGKHSTVKLCHWTKKSLRDEGVCYKQKFYGIQSHRCLQMTPNITCTNNCIFCWRVVDHTKGGLTSKSVDKPKDIIDNCIEAQRELLSGFKGFKGTNMKKWKEAQNPNQVAISLTGESTLYPKISELIEYCKNKNMTTFLVTNGQLPERLETITEPTQFYLSLDAPNKELYKKIDQPLFKDYWERLIKTIELMNSFSCKKVIRLTLVKGLNMSNFKEYAKLIEKSECDYIECKGYMWVGFSRYRLPQEAMPVHQEVKEFAEGLQRQLNYNIINESEPSRVVLLSKNPG